jgi:hypothetical protein
VVPVTDFYTYIEKRCILVLKRSSQIGTRGFKRTEIEIPVRYKPINHTTWYTTVTKGLGTGGVCLISKEYLGQGTEMKIQLPLPESDTTILATGLVIWSGFLIEKNVYESGIKFFRLNDGEKRTITAFIDDHASLPPSEREDKIHV